MKLDKRKVLFAAVALLLVAILSMGTVAWFNASKTVTNTFRVATSGDDDPDFAVDLYEHDADGQKVDSLEFNGITPGSTYKKDPTVENTGSTYDEWVRIKVTFNHANAWKAACTACSLTDMQDLFVGFDSDKWTRGADIADTDGDKVTYVYYLNSKLKPGKTATLFKKVTIPGDMDQTAFAGMTEFELKITADAIQADNTGDTCKDAFDNYWE